MDKVRTGENPPFRPEMPKIHDHAEHSSVVSLIAECWSEKPEARPSFVEIKKKLKILNHGKYDYDYIYEIYL